MGHLWFKAQGSQAGVLVCLSSMLSHDVLSGNFVVLPPTGFLVPQAEKPGSPSQNNRKKGLEGEAKVLGVSPAARGGGSG